MPTTKLTFTTVADAERYLYGDPALTQSRIESKEFREGVRSSGIETSIVDMIYEHAGRCHDIPSMSAALAWTILPTINMLTENMPEGCNLESDDAQALLGGIVERNEFFQAIHEKTGKTLWLVTRLWGEEERLLMIESTAFAPSSRPDLKMEIRDYLPKEYAKLLGEVQETIKNHKLSAEDAADLRKLQRQVQEKLKKLNAAASRIN